MTAGPSSVFARIAELDGRLRAFDRAWAGAGAALAPFPSGSSLASGGPLEPAFEDALVAVATGVGWPTLVDSEPSPAIFDSAVGATLLAGGVDPDGRIVAPVRDARLTQDFGPTSFEFAPPATVDGVPYAHFHDGLDLAAPLGRPVRAIAPGVVTFAGRTPNGAVVVRITHAGGSESTYGHLGAGLDVQEGDRVAAGEQIGVVGLTGNTTGPHLHLELWANGRAIDPAPVLASGRLPGAGPGVDLPDLPGVPGVPSRSAAQAEAAAALARFDAVADGIPFAAEIRAAAVSAGIDPLLFASLVRAESGFRPDAVSSAGALGLTQLMPATARALGVVDPFDPAQSLDGGARYFASNLRIYGRVDLALAAYQAGKGAVARAGGIPESSSTHGYINRILATWSGYLSDAGAWGSHR